jgi:sec-independent protein translocase protein TatA
MGAMMANPFNLPTILIIVLVIVLLFGSAKIPQLMKGMGSGIKEFKKGLAEGEGDAAKPPDKPTENPPKS